MINPIKIQKMVKDLPNLTNTIKDANDKINQMVDDIENLKKRVKDLEELKNE